MEKLLRFPTESWKRNENKKQISHSDRFSEFRLWREFCHHEKKEESLRLGEFNANVLRNLKHANENLRKYINFTTSLLVEKKILADIATNGLLA